MRVEVTEGGQYLGAVEKRVAPGATVDVAFVAVSVPVPSSCHEENNSGLWKEAHISHTVSASGDSERARGRKSERLFREDLELYSIEGT